MNRDNVYGVNNEQLDKLIQKILGNLEQLEKRFEQLDSVLDDTKSFYKGDSAVKYNNSYNNMRYNYKIIRNNILSYVNDLSKVKSKYIGLAESISIELNKAKVEN